MGLLDDVFGNELDNMLNQYPACVEDLNEGTVQAIFNRCFGAKGADGQSIERCAENKKSIAYLYGQLQLVHTPRADGILFTEGCYVRYDGKIWTNDKATMVKFFHLREAALLTHVNFKPTLSPKDPSFPAWWEAHKAEWEA